MPKSSKTCRRGSLGARRPPEKSRRRAGVRANPSLITYLANPSKRVRLASDVQAVLYRHARTREFYLHVFGNQGDGEIKREGSREYLRLDNLPSRTGVVLEAIGDGRALLVRHNEGKPLARDF